MTSVVVANTTTTKTTATGAGSKDAAVVTATVSFVPGSLGATAANRALVLQPPVASTQQTCLAGQIPTLCGRYDFKYYVVAVNGSVVTGTARATASLSTDKQQLILTALAVPIGATLLSVEALNEWPDVTVNNTAGLPMYPFAFILAGDAVMATTHRSTLPAECA